MPMNLKKWKQKKVSSLGASGQRAPSRLDESSGIDKKLTIKKKLVASSRYRMREEYLPTVIETTGPGTSQRVIKKDFMGSSQQPYYVYG